MIAAELLLPGLPLAMGLSSPWMLLGLLLAAIPILIHLFYRRRYEEVRWGAVLFLSKAVRRNAQRNRFQQLLLLILRTLAIVLLVIGFAGPMLNPSMTGAKEDRPGYHLFVLDDSLSMRATNDGLSRFDVAKDVMRKVIEAVDDTDQFEIVRASGLPASSSSGQASLDRESALREISSLTCSARAAEVSNATASLESKLSQLDDSVRRQIYVLSDFPEREWGAGDDRAKEALAQLAEGTDVTLINVAGQLGENTAVTARLPTQAVLIDKPVQIEGTIANYSSQSVSKTVRLTANDRSVGTETVTVAAGRQAAFQFNFRPRSEGPHRLVVQTDGDRLAEDDQFHLVVNAFERIPILLVNGKPSAEPLGNATDFLQLSLSPDDEATGLAPWATRVVNEAEFSSISLDEFGIVFLCDLRQFTRQEALKLRRYARSGGAVVLCPGDRADVGNYNSRVLGKGGLLAARLDQFVGNAVKPESSFSIDATRLSHPVVSVYRGNPGHGLEQVLNFRYLRATATDGTTRTALALENDDPVILEGPCGAGRVALVTISADRARWSTWNTGSGTYATLMNELCRFLVATTKSSSAERVGEPWSRSLPANARSSLVTNAAGDEIAAVVEQSGRDVLVNVDAIEQPGFIRVGTGPHSKFVAVNVTESESNLATAADAEIKAAFSTESSATVVSAAEFSLVAGADRTRNRGLVSMWVFALVFGLLLSEQALASRASRRVWLGMVVVGAAAVILLMVPQKYNLPVLVLAVALVLCTQWWMQRRTAAKPTSL